MCHLDGLKAARNLLPWPSPWDKAWMSIKKIIDSLHIRNHKDKSCQEKYNPVTLKEELPEGNTMAAEQTFVWLSRFKKILCAMPKVHHLFYLHQLVEWRNKYSVICYKNGKKPLLPKARTVSNFMRHSAFLEFNYDSFTFEYEWDLPLKDKRRFNDSSTSVELLAR